MSILPLSTTMTALAGTGAVAGGAGVAMGLAGEDKAQKIRQGTTLIGGIGGTVAMLGAWTGWAANINGYAETAGRLTGMSKAGQAAFLGAVTLSGVLALNILSELEISGPSKGSFIGGF